MTPLRVSKMFAVMPRSLRFAIVCTPSRFWLLLLMITVVAPLKPACLLRYPSLTLDAGLRCLDSMLVSAMNLGEVELTRLLPCQMLSKSVYVLSVCLLERLCERVLAWADVRVEWLVHWINV